MIEQYHTLPPEVQDVIAAKVDAAEQENLAKLSNAVDVAQRTKEFYILFGRQGVPYDSVSHEALRIIVQSGDVERRLVEEEVR